MHYTALLATPSAALRGNDREALALAEWRRAARSSRPRRPLALMLRLAGRSA
jgi:hypothetical protein